MTSRNGTSTSYFKLVVGGLAEAALVILLVATPLSGNSSHPKRVLVLHSYYQGYKWTDDENAGIASVLMREIGPTNFHTEYMDTKKIYGDLYTKRLYEVYKLKYRGYGFDLVITTDNNAFDFMQKYGRSLFPGTPVVFCGVNNIRESDIRNRKTFTGINENSDMLHCIELILKIHPATRQIVFINEWTSTGRGVHEEFQAATAHFRGSVSFLFLENERMEDIVSRLRQLSDGSIVLYTSFSRDRSGRIFSADESASLVTSNCKVPIYTTHNYNLGTGVVGGLILTGYDQGRIAADLALRVLHGERPETIPVTMDSPRHYIFDYEQLQRFKIPESLLPEGSTFINLPQSFYFKYRKWVDGAVGVFVALLVIISVLFTNIRKRKQIESELKTSRQQLRTLAWRLAETEDAERKALSRELHDEMGQNLTILGVNLKLMQSAMVNGSIEFVNSRISDSVAIVKQVTERVRAVMSNLRSPVLDDYGLVAAIELYGKQCADRTGIDIRINGADVQTRPSGPAENALFRIVQEALTNVIKHSRAEHVVIAIAVDGQKMTVTVEDDGVGYDSNTIAIGGERRGWGQVGMSERALAVGGTCRVVSRPGFGTCVIAEVPL